MIRGDFRDDIGIFAMSEMINMSLQPTHTHTHAQCHSFTPDMSSLCFSTEDILTEPDRTLRTVGPAGTVPASSTGTRMDVSSCKIYAYLLLVLHASKSACRGAQCCASCCHFESRQFSGSSVAGLLFCSVSTAQPDAAL